MTILLEGKGIRKTFKTGTVTTEVLKGIDFQVLYGDFIVVLGQSGSGKTTLLNIMGGMTKPSAGKLYYKERPLHNASEAELTFYRRKEVGFVFQHYNLMPNLTAYENVKLAAEIVPNHFGVKTVLNDVGLTDVADHFPSQLSGGEQQRVAIARAIVKKPALLLCDEPTGALDIQTGIQVFKVLQQLNQAYQMTILVITHNVEISKMANRIFYLRDGVIERVTTNEQPLAPGDLTW